MVLEQSAIIACGISGCLGVLLLAAGSRCLIPWNFRFANVLGAALVGFIGGAVIGTAVGEPRGSLTGESFHLIGFLFYHFEVALPLFGKPSADLTGSTRGTDSYDGDLKHQGL